MHDSWWYFVLDTCLIFVFLIETNERLINDDTLFKITYLIKFNSTHSIVENQGIQQYMFEQLIDLNIGNVV